MNWLRRNVLLLLLGLLVAACLILTIIVFVYYYTNFSDTGLSKSPQDWGVFGDYFGGTLNPIFTLINICITIWLTIIINRIANQNTNAQVNITRQVALIQLRHEALNELKKELNKNFNFWRNDQTNIDHQKSCFSTLNTFSINNNYLFDTNGIQEFQDILSAINNAISTSHTPTNLTSVMQHFLVADSGRETLFAELGKRTIEVN